MSNPKENKARDLPKEEVKQEKPRDFPIEEVDLDELIFNNDVKGLEDYCAKISKIVGDLAYKIRDDQERYKVLAEKNNKAAAVLESINNSTDAIAKTKSDDLNAWLEANNRARSKAAKEKETTEVVKKIVENLTPEQVQALLDKK